MQVRKMSCSQSHTTYANGFKPDRALNINVLLNAQLSTESIRANVNSFTQS